MRTHHYLPAVASVAWPSDPPCADVDCQLPRRHRVHEVPVLDPLVAVVEARRLGERDMGVFVTGTVQDMTAAEMLRQKVCCAVCLLAVVATDDCMCPCRGRWHGVLAETRVPDSADARKGLPPPQPEPEFLYGWEAAMSG